MKDYKQEKTFDKLVIGLWTILPESGKVSCEKTGDEIHLEPRLARLFSILGENVNNMVPRKQLIDEIWDDTLVNEESLTRAISDLRKMLKKQFVNPPKIETVPKRGYKMTVSMQLAKKPFWKIALKYTAYLLFALIMLILIIRGLNY